MAGEASPPGSDTLSPVALEHRRGICRTQLLQSKQLLHYQPLT